MLNNDPKYAAYERGDVIGKAGVEETYDELLRGQGRSRDVIVDSHGREVGPGGPSTLSPPGLKLTIDVEHSARRRGCTRRQRGAVVAMDPRNGEILALVSHPSLRPNAFACASIATTGTS